MFSLGRSIVHKVFEVKRDKDGGKNERRVLFLMDGVGSETQAVRVVAQIKANVQVIAITNDVKLAALINKETDVPIFDYGFGTPTA